MKDYQIINKHKISNNDRNTYQMKGYYFPASKVADYLRVMLPFEFDYIKIFWIECKMSCLGGSAYKEG